MADNARPVRNRRPTHPGIILREHYLRPRNISQAQFAKDIAISEKHLSQIVNGRAKIDATDASRIAKVLETTVELWLNLQVSVDAWDAREAAKEWKPAHTYPAPELALA